VALAPAITVEEGPDQEHRQSSRVLATWMAFWPQLRWGAPDRQSAATHGAHGRHRPQTSEGPDLRQPGARPFRRSADSPSRV